MTYTVSRFFMESLATDIVKGTLLSRFTSLSVNMTNERILLHVFLIANAGQARLKIYAAVCTRSQAPGIFIRPATIQLISALCLLTSPASGVHGLPRTAGQSF